MPNVTNKNPLVIDTAAESISTDPLRIAAVVIEPTAAAWQLQLHDASGGNLVFAARDNLKAPLSLPPLPESFSVSGLYATTVTNCRALVYLR